MDFFKQTKIYDFVKYSKWLFFASIALCVASGALVLIKDFKLGIDFAGGSVLQIQYKDVKEAPLAQIREILSKDARLSGFVLSGFGEPNEVLLKLPIVEEYQANISSFVKEKLAQTGSFEIRRENSIGAKVGAEFKKKAILAVVLSLVAMMVYIAYRYEYRFALAGILTLVHDVILTCGITIIWGIDFSLEVLAALLTLIGYSINDIIIIFDRIREKMMIKRVDDMNYVINEAVSATLSRTILTSLTVFFVVLTLFIFGGEIIKGFSTPMLFGVIIATYSSIFFAPRMVIMLRFDIHKYYEKEVNKQKRKAEKAKMRAMYESGRV